MEPRFWKKKKVLVGHLFRGREEKCLAFGNPELVQNSGIHMSFDPGILFLDIYPVGILLYMSYGVCYRLCISAWFVIANIRKVSIRKGQIK